MAGPDYNLIGWLASDSIWAVMRVEDLVGSSQVLLGSNLICHCLSLVCFTGLELVYLWGINNLLSYN